MRKATVATKPRAKWPEFWPWLTAKDFEHHGERYSISEWLTVVFGNECFPGMLKVERDQLFWAKTWNMKNPEVRAQFWNRLGKRLGYTEYSYEDVGY